VNARRLPSADIHRKLVEALAPGEGSSRKPDPYGFINFLLRAILVPSEHKRGRPSKRGPADEQRLLAQFEVIREHYQKLSGRRLSVMAVLERIATEKYSASRRPKRKELNTIEKRLSLARTARRRQAG
jgi:hypothetical protein